MTTTILESFDTQMLDYQNDLDFSMHVSTTDSWFLDEAVMADDGHFLHTHDVEVNMEPYDEDHEEYEMEDSLEPPELGASLLVDVDLDAASSPVKQTTITPTSSSPAPVNTSLDFGQSPVSGSDPHFRHARPSDSPQSSIISVVADVSSSNIPLLPSKEEPSSSTPFLSYADVTVAGGNMTPGALDAETHHIGVAPELDFEAVGASQHDPDNLYTDEEQSSGVGDGCKNILADRGTEEFNSDGGAVPSENTPEIPQPIVDQEEGPVEYDGSAGDPHEISEGVYIDPPPAVLLSIPNHPEISLFNTPLGADRHHPDLAVLLAHLPILYYEPISSVFEALRQEENLVAILEPPDGELVFDAYDLQLVVHEDSVYAREISFHDLNVLHDGLNISGSLRLRIRAVSPRFIVQYHTLQEQVARMTTAGFSGEVATSLVAGHQNPSRETQGQLENDVNAVEEPTEHYEDEIFAEYGNSTSNAAEQPVTYDKNEDEQEEGYKEEREAGWQDSADHNLQENLAPSGHEELTTDIKDEHDAIGEAQEEDKEQEDGAEPEDRAEQADRAEPEDSAEHEDGADREDTTCAATPIDNLLPIPTNPVATADFDGTAKNDDPVSVEDGYDEYTQHDELGDGEYAEVPLNEDNLPGAGSIVLSGHSETLYASDSAGIGCPTPHLLELVTKPDHSSGAEGHHDPQQRESSELQGEASNDQGLSELEPFHPVNELGVGPTANQIDDHVIFDEYDETEDVHRVDAIDEVEHWDPDPDTVWEAELETESNQSSATLSSKISSKRSISEAELEQNHDHLPSSFPDSPGPKRLRIE